MALAVRELELVIIARDNASSTLARVGGALAILGGTVARVGIEGIQGFAEMTREAIDFRKEIALAFTQVEIAGVTIDDVLNTIRESARNTAVPIEELVDSAFDIFSTFSNLESIEQAQDLLDGFAMSAVAGQAPIRDIGRAVIAWLNALNQAPTIENATKIMDVQFELVRKGAGTYTEFAGVIGKAIPAFVAAGQGVEELGASLAFTTKNGLSAAEGATSAARAIELLFSAKAIKGLRSVGIAIEDGAGNFRKMDEVIGDLVEHFKGLSDAERKLEFKEIFGTGRIQARRFFDLILREGNFEEFLFLLGEMKASSGEVATAFDIMMAEPAVQLDMFLNRWRVLRQEIGDAFIPFLVGKLMPALDRVLDWWEDLDKIQRENLVRWAAFATLFVTVGGAITAVVGGLVLIVGLLKVFAGSIAGALIIGGGLATIISAIAAAIALAILDWDKFIEIFGPWWDTILTKTEPFVEWLKREWPEAWTVAEDAYQGVRTFFDRDWPTIWENVKRSFEDAWEFIVAVWEENVLPKWEGFTTFVSTKASEIWESIETIADDLLAEWLPVWEQVMEEAPRLLGDAAELIRAILEAVITAIQVFAAVTAFVWENWGHNIVEAVRIAIDLVANIISGVLDIITGILQVFVGIFTADWETFWAGIKSIAEGVANIVGGIFEAIFNNWKNTFDALLPGIELNWANFWEGLQSVVATVASHIASLIAPLPALLWRLSPWSRGSPPLVEQVRTGLNAITKSYTDQLGELQRVASRQIPRIQQQMSGVHTVGLQPQGPVRIPSMAGVGPATQVGQHIDRQVNVDKVISQADAFEIATEIAWRELNS